MLFYLGLANRTGFRFDVALETPGHVAAKRKGLQDIEVGDPDFDRRFLLRSNDPGRLVQFLDGRTRDTLTGLSLLDGMAEVDVSLDQFRLLVVKRGRLSGAEEVEFRSLAGLLGHLLFQFLGAPVPAADSPGIRFIDGAAAEPADAADSAVVACPVCGEEITGRHVACSLCATPHHRDCWDYNGRCSTYGCETERFNEVDGPGD